MMEAEVADDYILRKIASDKRVVLPCTTSFSCLLVVW